MSVRISGLLQTFHWKIRVVCKKQKANVGEKNRKNIGKKTKRVELLVFRQSEPTGSIYRFLFVLSTQMCPSIGDGLREYIH